MVADHLSGRILDRFASANIDSHTRVKLQCFTARRRFRATEHHTHFLTQLVSENTSRLSLIQNRRQLPQRLTHQPRLHAHRGHAHVALQLGLGHERRHGVHHDHVQGIGARQGFANGQGLLAAIRLRHQQVIEVHTQLASVLRVERVLRINEGTHTPSLLGIGDHVQHYRGFARRFRSVNFDDAPLGHATDAEG